MATDLGETQLLFMARHKPLFFPLNDIAALSRVNRAFRDATKPFLTHAAQYESYYNLLQQCFQTTSRSYLNYDETEWDHIVYAIPGGLPSWTAQHWSLYYLYWLHEASMCANSTTVRCVNSGTESRVSMLLHRSGLLKQLPNTNGTLCYSWYPRETGYMVTMFTCRVGTGKKTMVARIEDFFHPTSGSTLNCDWQLVVDLWEPMYRAADRMNATPPWEKAQQVVFALFRPTAFY